MWSTDMLSTTSFPQVTVDEVVSRIFSSRRITRIDQRLFMMLLSQCLVTEEERAMIDRVYEGLRAGLLRVAD
jgi:hypothetical protein